jgi:hypothetical protein
MTDSSIGSHSKGHKTKSGRKRENGVKKNEFEPPPPFMIPVPKAGSIVFLARDKESPDPAKKEFLS